MKSISHILEMFVLLRVHILFVACLQGMDGGCSCEVFLTAFRESLNIPFRVPKRSVACSHSNQRQTRVPVILCCHFR
jgi:hypothetical protein